MGPLSYELADFNLCTAQPNAARRRKKKEAEKFPFTSTFRQLIPSEKTDTGC